MKQDPRLTGYARLTPRTARVVFAVLVLLCGLCVTVTLSPLASGNADNPPLHSTDVQLYRAEIDRIRAGEGYYEAANAELRARGYTTRSVFNWRTPTPFWVMGWMPAVVLGKALLCALALAVMLTAFEALAREQNNVVRRPIACAVLLTGPLMPCILADLFVMPVLWAGVLIALSVGAHGVGRPRWGVALGLAAVFFRELALPYCLVAAAIAWRGGRRRELTAWVVGLTAFLVFFTLHCLQASTLIRPGDRAHAESWVQFGGLPYVISTAQMNAYLVLLPQWLTALYFVAALFGLAGWHTPLGLRVGLTVSAFVVMFGVIGQPFNQYWGSLVAPLLCFGVVRFPASLRDLWLAASARAAVCRPAGA